MSELKEQGSKVLLARASTNWQEEIDNERSSIKIIGDTPIIRYLIADDIEFKTNILNSYILSVYIEPQKDFYFLTPIDKLRPYGLKKRTLKKDLKSFVQ